MEFKLKTKFDRLSSAGDYEMQQAVETRNKSIIPYCLQARLENVSPKIWKE